MRLALTPWIGRGKDHQTVSTTDYAEIAGGTPQCFAFYGETWKRSPKEKAVPWPHS